MINISGCEFDEFAAYMSKQFGEGQFQNGFEIIKKNRHVAYEINGEQRLRDMLGHLKWDSDDAAASFINFCTTYLIVQNMQC